MAPLFPRRWWTSDLQLPHVTDVHRAAIGPSREPAVPARSRNRRTRTEARSDPVPPGGRPTRRSPQHLAPLPSGGLPCDPGRPVGVRTSSARVPRRAREGGGPERHGSGWCARPVMGSSGRRTAGRSAVRRHHCDAACSRTGVRIRNGLLLPHPSSTQAASTLCNNRLKQPLPQDPGIMDREDDSRCPGEGLPDLPSPRATGIRRPGRATYGWASSAALPTVSGNAPFRPAQRKKSRRKRTRPVSSR